jgi:hypothetical protein
MGCTRRHPGSVTISVDLSSWLVTRLMLSALVAATEYPTRANGYDHGVPCSTWCVIRDAAFLHFVPFSPPWI